jgi:hypothetical protein
VIPGAAASSPLMAIVCFGLRLFLLLPTGNGGNYIKGIQRKTQVPGSSAGYLFKSVISNMISYRYPLGIPVRFFLPSFIIFLI